jgi:hypothetical protein
MRANDAMVAKVRWLVGVLLTVAMFPATVPPAFALPVAPDPNPVFELDGNAITNNASAGLPDDWDRVCHSVLATDCSTTNNANTAIVEFASQSASNGTTFTGGGSKDPNDISSWAWNQGSGGLPGKDILLNGFAARYTVPSTGPTDTYCTAPAGSTTCSVIFFGMDRFDNSGDAQNGFWFFQNKIELGTNSIGGGEGFVGVHKNGDILVVSDFSVGGTTSTISVYVWNDSCTAAGKPVASCADSNLQLLASSNAANCATAAANAAFCGIVNSSTSSISSPWSFKDKSGTTGCTPADGGCFAQGEFFEGGINLSAFPGLAGECFASTMAESRSSTSTSAVLKSFILGNFGQCGSGTTTTPQDSNGNNISTISIGSGSVQVQDQAVVTVTGAASWSGSVAFSLCGPADLVSQPSCLTGGTSIGSKSISGSGSTPVTVTSDLATVTSAGKYCWRADFTSTTTGVPASSDASSTECFTVTPVTPKLSTQASGPVQLGQLISDTATLSGTANEPGTPVINPTTAGSAAKGTITFKVYGPNDCTTLANTFPDVNVSGDGNYSSGSFKPTAVGTYTFVASYSGDSPNTNAAGPTACPDTSGTETVLVSDTTTNTTAQTWLPNDSATVTSTGGSALSGSVTFTLYSNGTCTAGTNNANVLYTETDPVSGASPQTISTQNTTKKVTTSQTVSWQAVFSSGSGTNVAGSTSTCETTALTITN